MAFAAENSTPRLGNDQFGGLEQVPLARGAQRFFRVEKVGSRWVFVTPTGNIFWMLGVFNVSLEGTDERGMSYSDWVLAKYGNVNTWGLQTARRLKGWGFNTAAEYTDYRVWGKMPTVHILNSAGNSLTNRWSLASGPVKEIISSTDPAVYRGYRGGTMPDVFDPNFTAYVDRFLAQDSPGIRPMYGTPWLLGIATDDRDYLYGFGAGDEVRAYSPHAHLGLMVLIGKPEQSTGYGGAKYSDSAYHAKLALRDMLREKYGRVAVLNAAWGSAYTSWESVGGWGTGTGLLDERGLNPWVPRDYVRLTGANAAFKADLNDYLYRLAKRYFVVMKTAIRKYAGPNHLIFGPATLNSDGLTRRQILQAAGEEVDVIQASIESPEVLELTYQYTGRPIVTWEGLIANPDSAMYRHAQPSASWTAKTQPQRGRLYATRITAAFHGKTQAGIKPIVGIKWWEFHDNSREKNNWGLVTLADNAYDGKEAVVAGGKDSWGYPIGGEQRDYGDFLSAVRSTHAGIEQALVEEIAPQSRQR